MMSKPRVWTVDITFTETEDRTRADAVLEAGTDRYHGWGRSRRNPVDPDRPRIGEEIAAADALESLVAKLRLEQREMGHSLDQRKGPDE